MGSLIQIYLPNPLSVPYRTHVNYLLVNLAVADILFATFIAPRIFFKLTFTHHPDGMIGTVLCKLLTDANVANVGAGSSIVTMVAIAVERYYAVMYPFGNKGELTQRKLKVCNWLTMWKLPFLSFHSCSGFELQ